MLVSNTYIHHTVVLYYSSTAGERSGNDPEPAYTPESVNEAGNVLGTLLNSQSKQGRERSGNDPVTTKATKTGNVQGTILQRSVRKAEHREL